MINILNKYDPSEIKLPQIVKIDMEKRNSKIIPEDVYFSICSERDGLNIPNRNIASQFSQESILSNNPFGGHQWWLAYSNINIGINDDIVIHKTIPKIIIQTFREQNLEEYLQKIVDKIKILNNDYKYLYFSDIDCMNFLENNFSPIVLKCYNKIKPGAFKADLFRYCALYIHGGI
jgi:mannosyltransferase OCH1-like enzyme